VSERETQEALEALRHIVRELARIAAVLEQLAIEVKAPATYARPVGIQFSGR
jgi:hypothetical protein